jgi:hypothetical protein
LLKELDLDQEPTTGAVGARTATTRGCVVVPPRITRGRRVSPLFASIGPSPRYALTVTGSPGEAARLLADWEAWRREYGGAYDAGERVPGPPHAALLDCFARPAA